MVGYTDKTEQLFNELGSLKDQMMENLDKSMKRGDKIELTMMRSDSLVNTSVTYKSSAKQVKVAQRKKFYQMVACGMLAVLVSKSIQS